MNAGTWSYYVEKAQLRQRPVRTPVRVAYVPGHSPQQVDTLEEAEDKCRGVKGALIEVEFRGGES